MREIAVFGGTAHPALAAEICADLGVPQRPVRFTRFANDCLKVQLQSNCIRRSRSSASSGSRAGPGRLSTLTGASPGTFNDISHPDDVSISRTSVAATDDSCRVLLRPHSVNILRLETADAER